MSGHECYHCKQWVEAGEAHDCWTTTESALTRDLPEDIQEAYDRLRETVVEFGEQRIYASHKSIMFSRRACYFFVRPKRSALEIVFFLGRTIKAPQIRKVVESSRTKRAHIVNVKHRDEVESPVTDWLREAYDMSDILSARPKKAPKATPPRATSKPRRVSAAASKASTSRTARRTRHATRSRSTRTGRTRRARR